MKICLDDPLIQFVRYVPRATTQRTPLLAPASTSILFLLFTILSPVFAGAGQNPKPRVAAPSSSPNVPNVASPAPPSTQVAGSAPSLALSPGVIMVNAQPGQSTTQKLTITNLTSTEFHFTLEAMDVAVREGKRVFVPAGELPGSIARTAVFSPQAIVVQPGAASTVSVTVTIPENPAGRAMVAIFRSKTLMQGRGSVAMTASVGTLLTFTLSKKFQLESSGIHFDGASEGDDLVVSEWITNVGSEPVVAKGVVAVLKSTGNLMGKVPMGGMRLLPGERLQFKADYPSTLKQGKYRALITLEYDSGVLTTSSEFDIQ